MFNPPKCRFFMGPSGRMGFLFAILNGIGITVTASRQAESYWFWTRWLARSGPAAPCPVSCCLCLPHGRVAGSNGWIYNVPTAGPRVRTYVEESKEP